MVHLLYVHVFQDRILKKMEENCTLNNLELFRVNALLITF